MCISILRGAGTLLERNGATHVHACAGRRNQHHDQTDLCHHDHERPTGPDADIRQLRELLKRLIVARLAMPDHQ